MPTKEDLKAAVEKAGEEAAKKVGLSDDAETQQVGEEEAVTEETTETTTEEVPAEETEEAEEEEVAPKKGQKTVPYDRFKEVYGRAKTLERILEQVMTRTQAEKTVEATQEKVELPDFDTMTNKETVSWIMDNLGKRLDAVVNKVVAPIQRESRASKAEQEVTACAARHTDYWDYADKMVDIANKYPNLGAEDVYTLAKGNNPAAAKKVVKKMVDKMKLKQKANTERRSSPADKVEKKAFTGKNPVKEAGMQVAEQLGLLK